MKIAVAAANSSESSATLSEKPEIELEFIGVHISEIWGIRFLNFILFLTIIKI